MDTDDIDSDDKYDDVDGEDDGDGVGGWVSLLMYTLVWIFHFRFSCWLSQFILLKRFTYIRRFFLL